MEEPDWAKVIRILHNEAPDWPSEEIDEEHPFVTEGGLEPEAAKAAVDALIEWNLASHSEIRREGGKYNPDTGKIEEEDIILGYKLQPEGFEVAHERELAQRDHNINISLVFLTLTLVITRVLDVVPLSDMGKVISGVLVLVLLLYFIMNEEIIEK